MIIGACIAATHDNNKFSNINGKGSIGLNNNIPFNIIQNTKNPQNINMNFQLPTASLILSAAFSPNEILLPSCLSISTAKGLSIY